MAKSKKRSIDLGEFKEFIPDYLEDKLFKSRKQITAVQFKRFSLDEQCEKDIKNGKAFFITNPEFIKNNKRTIDGIFSPRFGADAISKDNTAIFSCHCQKLTGSIKLGQKCDVCNQEVQYFETDLSVVAYIDIAPYRVLTNTGIIELKKHFKIRVITDVITKNPKITLKGHRDKSEGEITLIDLYENYEELYEEKIGIPRKYLFTSKIPVFNAALRPLIMNGVKITHFPVNKDYLAIVSLQNDLVDVVRSKGTEVQVLKILNKIQGFYNKIEVEIDEQCNGKVGRFRKDMVAARINYVARMVITLDDTLRPSEIILPYTTFMVEYEEEITREIKKMLDCSTKEALSYFFKGQNKVTKITKRAIENLISRKDGIWAIINRNPTIAFGSVLVMKVAHVNFNISDKTMYLPPDILPLLNADFDGDQLTQIALKFQELINAYTPFFKPTYMMINRSDGYFNPSLGHKKDFAAILSALSEISRKINAHMEAGQSNLSIIEDLKRFGFDMSGEFDVDANIQQTIIEEFVDVQLR